MSSLDWRSEQASTRFQPGSRSSGTPTVGEDVGNGSVETRCRTFQLRAGRGDSQASTGRCALSPPGRSHAHARAMKGLKQPDAVPAAGDGAEEYAAWLVVVKALRSVVPHIDIEDINRYEPLQDEADLDTSDWMQLMAAVTEQTGVVVPEQDYPLVDTFDGLEQYLAAQSCLEGVDPTAGAPRRSMSDARPSWPRSRPVVRGDGGTGTRRSRKRNGAMRADVLDGSPVAASLSDAATQGRGWSSTGSRSAPAPESFGSAARSTRLAARSSNVDLVGTCTTRRSWPTPRWSHCRRDGADTGCPRPTSEGRGCGGVRWNTVGSRVPPLPLRDPAVARGRHPRPFLCRREPGADRGRSRRRAASARARAARPDAGVGSRRAPHGRDVELQLGRLLGTHTGRGLFKGGSAPGGGRAPGWDAGVLAAQRNVIGCMTVSEDFDASPRRATWRS